MQNSSNSGFLFFKDDSVCLRFQFNKDRYRFLYSLSGATYKKDESLWYVPIFHLKKITSSKYFSKSTIDYQVPDDVLEATIKNNEKEKKESLKRVAKNPFCVSKNDILISEPDVVIFLSKEKNSLRVVLKPKTKIKQKIIDQNFCPFLKDEHLFFLPISRLNLFLKFLRDNEVIFAVEEECSNVLKEGSDIRKAVLSNKKNDCDSVALKQALLYPFVFRQEDSNGLFSFSYSDNFQLTAGFKHIKSHVQRKKISQNFTENELKRVLFNLQQANIECFKTKEINAFLSQKRKGAELQNSSTLDDEDLALNVPDICFEKEQEGAVLLIKKDIFKNKLLENSFFCNKEKSSHDIFKEHYKLILKEKSLLLDFPTFEKELKNASISSIICTKSFLSFLDDLREREEKVKRCEYFRRLKDCKIGFKDSDFEKTLFPHQRVAVSWLLEFESALLGDDMGLGKTLSVLSCFKFLREEEKIDLLLVICPNSLTTNWEREANTWTPDLWVKTILGTKSKREKTLKKILTQGVEIAIINYESARLDDISEKLLEISQKKKIMICFDESQKLKNPTSKTFKALRKIAKNAKRKVLLSGTPIPCNIVDIWSQMLILDDGKRFGTNYYKWLTEVAEVGTKWSEFAVKKLKEDKVNEAILRVLELLLRRKKEEVVNLPEKLFSIRDLEMKGSQKEKYDSLCKELIVELKNTDGETYTKQIDNILEQYLRAVQIATNPRLIDETWKGDPVKFLELDDIVSELVREGGRKLVVWTNYKRNVDELVERYTDLGTAPFYGDLSTQERKEIIEKFQDKESNLKILVAIPAAGGVGITLHAAQTCVYLDKTWNAEHYLQSIDRIHRIGQTGTVNIILLHSAKVDVLIYKNLKRKEKQQALMLGDKKTFVPISYPTKEELIEALLN